MTKFADDVVALLHFRKNIVQAVCTFKSASGESTLCKVADGNVGVEPAREHLSPACPRLRCLVNHSGVSAEEHGGGCGVTLNLDAAHSRSCAIELQRQFVVPMQIVLLSVLDVHTVLLVNLGGTLVDNEFNGLQLSFLRFHILEEKTATFSTNCCLAGAFLVAKGERHLIIAIRHFYGKIKRSGAFLRWLRQNVVTIAYGIGIDGLVFRQVEIETLGMNMGRYCQCQGDNCDKFCHKC